MSFTESQTQTLEWFRRLQPCIFNHIKLGDKFIAQFLTIYTLEASKDPELVDEKFVNEMVDIFRPAISFYMDNVKGDGNKTLIASIYGLLFGGLILACARKHNNMTVVNQLLATGTLPVDQTIELARISGTPALYCDPWLRLVEKLNTDDDTTI